MGAGARGRTCARLVQPAVALWALALHVASVPAHGVELQAESAVKAAFVLRFLGYVQWPPGAARDRPLGIAVLGDAALAMNLEELARGRSVDGRALRIHRIDSPSQAAGSDVLVVGASRRWTLGAVLKPVEERAILVITAEEGALDAGSVINFLKEEERIRFEISLPAAQGRGLRVSSELLSVAARVRR